MWAPDMEFHPHQLSPRPRCSKQIFIYVLVLLLSLSFTSGQRSPFNHQIDNRSPEIDPFWYVGRGVRPIGRFGKRQLKFGRDSLRSGSSLDLILNALREHEALEEALEEGGDVW